MLFYAITTISHLFQVEMLAHSLYKYYPDALFKIGLVDKLTDDIDLSTLTGIEIVEVEKLAIPELKEMAKRYRISELCFACKPYFAQYFFSTNEKVDKIVYLDGDIFIFNRLDEVEKLLDTYSLVLTPHGTRLNMDQTGLENYFLDIGIFNGGFFACNRSAEAMDFLKWFSAKLITYANRKGWDQIWFNHCVVYFEKMYILNDPGYNLAGWNINSRDVHLDDGKYKVNGNNLVFFHYSNFNLESGSFNPAFQIAANKLENFSGVANLLTTAYKQNHFTGLRARKSFYDTRIKRNGLAKKIALFFYKKVVKLFDVMGFVLVKK